MNLPIVREGFIYIAFFVLLTVLAYYFTGIYMAILPAVIAVFMMFFFRNPERSIPQDECVIVSPADGKVMSVERVLNDDFVGGECVKVTVFLSVFNVHVNRSPIAGEIKFKRYTCGRFIPAYDKLAAWENERLTIGIENTRIKVLVTQVAGILARRIVSWVTLGASLTCGERYGMIKFGSCTEIIMPTEVEILVAKGDKVRGGETVIGRMKRN